MKCINDTRICVEPKGQKLSRQNGMREGRKCCVECGGGGRKMGWIPPSCQEPLHAFLCKVGSYMGMAPSFTLENLADLLCVMS